MTELLTRGIAFFKSDIAENHAYHHPVTNTQHLSAGNANDIKTAVALLLQGKLVAIPTETVYGLAASALDPAAIAGIFTAKQRPHWDPLIVHIADQAMLPRIVREITHTVQRLMDALWPGPLTLLLPRNLDLPSAVTAGRDLVGVRMPAHPVALDLLRSVKLPLAAPSANTFGHISPSTAQHVLDDLNGRIDAVLDAGPCTLGVESTVYDPASMTIYRQGGVSIAQIEAVTGTRARLYQRREDTTRSTDPPESLPSPGVGMRHYAPRAAVFLLHDEAHLHSLLPELNQEGNGILLPLEWTAPNWQGTVLRWASWHDSAALARTLYSCLRELDAGKLHTILCPLPPASTDPLAGAIRDRLMKAARDV